MDYAYEDILPLLEKQLASFSNGKMEIRWILQSFGVQPHTKISKNLYTQIKEKVFRRKNHYPLEYLLGDVFFLNEKFQVCEGVLIPREDSAVLVQYLIKNAPPRAKILEIGTGTGILSLTLKKEREDVSIIAMDINPRAIECALRNENNLFRGEKKIKWIQGDFFQKIWDQPFDVLLSNPPYLKEEEWIEGQEELHFEPQNAFLGGKDGLLFYREIFRRKEELVAPGGQLVLEISPPRWLDIQREFHKDIISHKLLYDLSNRERGLIIFT